MICFGISIPRDARYRLSFSSFSRPLLMLRCIWRDRKRAFVFSIEFPFLSLHRRRLYYHPRRVVKKADRQKADRQKKTPVAFRLRGSCFSDLDLYQREGEGASQLSLRAAPPSAPDLAQARPALPCPRAACLSPAWYLPA